MNRATALLLACAPLTCFSGEAATIYNATSHVSCGSYESGAYHITVDTLDDVILIYANDLGEPSWVIEPNSRSSRELSVMSCRIDVSQCTLSTKASLQLRDGYLGEKLGVLTYEKFRSGTTTIKFRTKPEHPALGAICG